MHLFPDSLQRKNKHYVEYNNSINVKDKYIWGNKFILFYFSLKQYKFLFKINVNPPPPPKKYKVQTKIFELMQNAYVMTKY